MRLTTDFFVSALVRRVFATGGFGAVVRRGATEAGAVFVLLRDRFGRMTLYGPASQTDYDSAKPDDRYFRVLMEDAEQEAVDVRLAKEFRFDPDGWVVEVEPGGEPIDRLIEIRTP